MIDSYAVSCGMCKSLLQTDDHEINYHEIKSNLNQEWKIHEWNGP